MDQDQKNRIQGKGYIMKSALCRAYRVSPKVLQTWLNFKYFEDLKSVGYSKSQHGLTPRQLEVLIDKIGEP